MAHKEVKRKCSRCGGAGHNAKTCGRKNEIRSDGVRVRELAPGVSGEELEKLDKPRATPAIARPDGSGPTRSAGATPVDVELRVRVRIEIEVVQT